MSRPIGLPQKQGLYDPKNEHDACGIGFVVNIKGQKSNKIVTPALEVLCNLDHRGARGSEPETGDGAGILMQIPHRFLQAACEGIGIELPSLGKYGVGMVFLSSDRDARQAQEKALAAVVEPAQLDSSAAQVLRVGLEHLLQVHGEVARGQRHLRPGAVQPVHLHRDQFTSGSECSDIRSRRSGSRHASAAVQRRSRLDFLPNGDGRGCPPVGSLLPFRAHPDTSRSAQAVLPV